MMPQAVPSARTPGHRRSKRTAATPRRVTGQPRKLRPGDLDAKFFRKPLADFFRQAVMHSPRSLLGGIEHGHRRRSSHSHAQPDQRGQSQSRSAPQSPARKACRGPRYRITPKARRNTAGGNRRQGDQAHVNNAMNFLPASAVLAGGEVVFVVAAHLRRQAGYVIPPARQDLANDRINALLTHAGVTKLS